MSSKVVSTSSQPQNRQRKGFCRWPGSVWASDPLKQGDIRGTGKPTSASEEAWWLLVPFPSPPGVGTNMSKLCMSLNLERRRSSQGCSWEATRPGNDKSTSIMAGNVVFRRRYMLQIANISCNIHSLILYYTSCNDASCRDRGSPHYRRLGE